MAPHTQGRSARPTPSPPVSTLRSPRRPSRCSRSRCPSHVLSGIQSGRSSPVLPCVHQDGPVCVVHPGHDLVVSFAHVVPSVATGSSSARLLHPSDVPVSGPSLWQHFRLSGARGAPGSLWDPRPGPRSATSLRSPGPRWRGRQRPRPGWGRSPLLGATAAGPQLTAGTRVCANKWMHTYLLSPSLYPRTPRSSPSLRRKPGKGLLSRHQAWTVPSA